VLSLIIPAKELDECLFEAIYNYTLTFNRDYEIIIVYDFTDKKVYEKFNNNFNNNKKIILLLSPIKGRINALNYGYTQSKGDIIKCIDADDTLLSSYFDELEIIDNCSAHCHNASLIDSNNSVIGTYTFEKNILFKDYQYVLSNLKSPPRWVWSFNREIAECIFPIPPELFAEDVWFSLIIKKNCDKIFHLNSEVYLYKQHDGGEWGGIKNFSADVMSRRARWNLKLIPVLLKNKIRLGIVSDDIFSNIISYYKVLLNKKSISNIILSKTTIYYKAKLFLIMYSPSLATLLISIKWLVNKQFIAIKKS
jgi:glycosyltransferase involved in cell wall biosynthesis